MSTVSTVLMGQVNIMSLKTSILFFYSMVTPVLEYYDIAITFKMTLCHRNFCKDTELLHGTTCNGNCA